MNGEEKLQQQIDELNNRLNDIEEDRVTRDVPVEQQEAMRDIVSDKLADMTWNKVFYVSSFAAESVTTSSSTEDVSAREVDTSEGKYFDPKLPSRFRMNFYLNSGQANSTVYILSPAVNGVNFSTAVPLSDSTAISYVGIKIIQTKLNLVSYNYNTGAEKLVDTGFTITDNTTHTLELIYRPGDSSDVYYDTNLVGTIEHNLIENASIKVYYPYLTSIKSSSGSVNLTIENYEFLQERFVKERI